MEIPLFAALLRIPVVGVSFTSFGTNPWMAKSTQLTVNNPLDGEQILNCMGLQLEPENEDEGDEELPELPGPEEVIS
jgi:hypothetical protein